MLRNRTIYFISFLLLYVKAESYVPFVRDGNVYRTSAVIDISLKVDPAVYLLECNDLRKAIARLQSGSTLNYQSLRKNLIQQVDRACLELAYMLPRARYKRQLLTFGLGAIAALVSEEFFSSSSHSAEMQDHRFEEVREEIKYLQKFANATSRYLQKLEVEAERQISLLRLDSLVGRLGISVKSLTNGHTSLWQGKLTPDTLPLDSSVALLKNLTAFAVEKHLKLPFSDPALLYTFPVRREGKRFFISVPLVSHSFELWRFLHTPILINEDTAPAFVIPMPAVHLLAFDPDSGETISMSDHKLAQCVVWQKNHFCSYLAEEDPDFCLTHLFHSPAEIDSSCDFKQPQFAAAYVLSHLDEARFLLTLNESSLSFETRCKGQSTFGSYQFGQTVFTVPNRCSITTKYFTIPSFTPVRSEIRLRPLPPRLQLALPKSHVKAPAFSARQLSELDLYSTSYWTFWPYHVSTWAGLVIIISLFFVVLRCAYSRCKTSKTQ